MVVLLSVVVIAFEYLDEVVRLYHPVEVRNPPPVVLAVKEVALRGLLDRLRESWLSVLTDPRHRARPALAVYAPYGRDDAPVPPEFVVEEVGELPEVRGIRLFFFSGRSRVGFCRLSLRTL